MFIKLKHIVLSICLISQLNSLGQTNDIGFSLSYGAGTIIKHKSSIGHLVKAHPQFYALKWHRKLDTTSLWKKQFNYPEQSVGLLYQNFRYDKLGKVIALNYHTTFYLLNRANINQLKIDLGLGFAYATTPYNLETNNQNSVISTHLTYSNHLSVGYQRSFSRYFSSEIGLHFTHFSNSGLKKPNNGINSVFLGLNLHYNNKPTTDFPLKEKCSKLSKQPLHAGLVAKLGFHEAHSGLGTEPVYEFSPYISKQIGKFSHLNTGFDLMLSEADKTYAEYLMVSDIENPDRTLQNTTRLGINVGYEQYFNQISCEVDMGYYLHSKLDIYRKFYENIRIKYHLKDSKWHIGLGLKLHRSKANYSTLEVQYQWL